MTKPSQKQIEIKNLQEEISEILEPCVKCGMCKSLCPVFKAMQEEYYSPRGRSIMLPKKLINELAFKCTFCRACEKSCPLKIKVYEATKKAREILNLQDQELESNKEMMKNIRETGNPFGKNPNKSKLYCC